MINYAWQRFKNGFYKALLLFVSRQGFRKSELRELLWRVSRTSLGFEDKLVPCSSGLPYESDELSTEQTTASAATMKAEPNKAERGLVTKISTNILLFGSRCFIKSVAVFIT